MRVKLSVAQPYFTERHLLRKPDSAKVQKYADALNNGDPFPAIILGEYPGALGTETILVDGVHRLQAHVLAKQKSIAVEFVSYPDEAHALADQLARNLRHGQTVGDYERDTRIKLLSNQYHWTLRQIGREVGLHFTSIGRILRELQHAGKRGPKPGSVRHIVPATPTAFIRIIRTADLTLANASTKKEILGKLLSDDTSKQELRQTLTVMEHTGRHLVELAHEVRKTVAA